MRMKTKTELLSHYAKKDPRAFRQFDGFQVGSGDDVMRPDDDGDCLMGASTCELMTGADVRVLIPADTASADAITLLRKIITWIERDGGFQAVNVPWLDNEGVPF